MNNNNNNHYFNNNHPLHNTTNLAQASWAFDPPPAPSASSYRNNGTSSAARQQAAQPRYPPPPASSSNPFVFGASANPMMDTGYDDRGVPAPPPLTTDSNFDIIEWHPAYQSCQRYFLDHAQHEPATQALCALINIRLPFQWLQNPIYSSTPPHQNQHQSQSQPNPNPFAQNPNPSRSYSGPLNSSNRSSRPTNDPPVFISLIPYLRRLCITGFDKPPILHGLFGDDYTRGILPHLDCERRNYLFASKSAGWATCKSQYDAGSSGGVDGLDETVPFMKPLDEASAEELAAAEKAWSQWLAMEDWMVGPRAPEGEGQGEGQGEETLSAGSGGWNGRGHGRHGHEPGHGQGGFQQSSGRGMHPELPDGL
ncbi:hypothetical protein MBLNU230_g6319t1 [Neophaeotheca triangularis]